MGYLARTGDVSEANLRRAVIYGSAMGSFAVERFSVQRLLEISSANGVIPPLAEFPTKPRAQPLIVRDDQDPREERRHLTRSTKQPRPVRPPGMPHAPLPGATRSEVVGAPPRAR